MSLDCLQPSTHPPLKRLRETISLATISNAKCGEIFVTSNWDKWSFNCTYCHMSTADIGVFVCHIRLQHLSAQDIPNVYETNNSSDHQQSLTCHNPPAHDTNDKDSLKATPKDCEIITKTESLAINEENLPPTIEVNSETTCTKVAKIINLETQNKAEEVLDNNNENENHANLIANDCFSLPSAENRESAQNDHNCEKEIVQFVYMNDDDEEEDLADDLEFIKTNESITIDDYDEEETESNYNVTDDGEPMEEEGVAQEEEEEEKEEEEAEEEELLTTLAVSTTNKRKNKSKKYKCSYCNRDFKSQPGLNYHLTHAHDDTYCKKLRYKCKKCEKGFGTLQGLKTHKLLHDKNSYFKCPVCPIKNPLISQFLKHVMTHKRDTCHPCQVCGQVFDNDAERLRHWNTHAKDLPYDCDVCARRFRKPHVLIHHKKSHGQYNCYFCSAIFQSVHTLHTPYACPSCELMPDIREKVDFQRSLAEKKQV